jgi:hypothetical protein
MEGKHEHKHLHAHEHTHVHAHEQKHGPRHELLAGITTIWLFQAGS